MQYCVMGGGDSNGNLWIVINSGNAPYMSRRPMPQRVSISAATLPTPPIPTIATYCQPESIIKRLPGQGVLSTRLADGTHLSTMENLRGMDVLLYNPGTTICWYLCFHNMHRVLEKDYVWNSTNSHAHDQTGGRPMILSHTISLHHHAIVCSGTCF